MCYGRSHRRLLHHTIAAEQGRRFWGTHRLGLLAPLLPMLTATALAPRRCSMDPNFLRNQRYAKKRMPAKK